jgi:hypothetical protein
VGKHRIETKIQQRLFYSPRIEIPLRLLKHSTPKERLSLSVKDKTL